MTNLQIGKLYLTCQIFRGINSLIIQIALEREGDLVLSPQETFKCTLYYEFGGMGGKLHKCLSLAFVHSLRNAELGSKLIWT